MSNGEIEGKETIVKIDEINALQGNMPTTTGNLYAWNQKGGVIASSTHNITGVYDFVGGTWEATASYIANNQDNLLSYGESVAYEGEKLKTTSTKYTMVYPHDSNIDNPTKQNNTQNMEEAGNANYLQNIKIYGDAIREISTEGNGFSSWLGNSSMFVALGAPFIMKGGDLWYSSHVGTFYFARDDGNNDFAAGFRPVVVPM